MVEEEVSITSVLTDDEIWEEFMSIMKETTIMNNEPRHILIKNPIVLEELRKNYDD